MDILKELYYGNIDPTAKTFDRNSPYAKSLKTVVDNQDEMLLLFKNSTDAQKLNQLFSELMDAQCEIQGIGKYESFIDGFHLGARLILDTFIMPRNSQFKSI